MCEDTAVDATANDTPEVARESLAELGESRETASEEAVLKKAAEKELPFEARPVTSASELAPTTTEAVVMPTAPSKSTESCDVSPRRKILTDDNIFSS